MEVVELGRLYRGRVMSTATARGGRVYGLIRRRIGGIGGPGQGVGGGGIPLLRYVNEPFSAHRA